MRVFVFSHAEDIHADAVEAHLRSQGVNVLRLNSNQLSDWSLQFHHNAVCIVLNGELVPVTDADRYFIRFLPNDRDFQSIGTGLDPEILSFCGQQHAIHFQDALSALVSVCRGIDKPHIASAAQSKALQLMLAREVGLATPDTYTGSDPASAWSFCSYITSKNERLCQKPVLGRMLDFDGRKYSSFTELTEVKREDLGTLGQCPVTLQRYVPKAYELRVAVVDGHALAARIDSQLAGGRTAIDWRNYNLPQTPHSVHVLPQTISERLVLLNEKLGVRYSSMDIIVDQAGQHVFLEANIKGQWLWLDDLVGLGVTNAIADAILR